MLEADWASAAHPLEEPHPHWSVGLRCHGCGSVVLTLLLHAPPQSVGGEAVADEELAPDLGEAVDEVAEVVRTAAVPARVWRGRGVPSGDAHRAKHLFASEGGVPQGEAVGDDPGLSTRSAASSTTWTT